MQKANWISQHLLACHRICSPVCLARHRSFSTRTHASGFHPAFLWVTHALAGGWTLPVLCCYRSLLGGRPHQTPTSSGEYYSVRTCHFHTFHALSTTIHSSPFHYSLRPCRLGHLGQLHLEGSAESHRSASPVSCPGASSRNDLMKTACTWACEVWGWRSVPCMKRKSHSWWVWTSFLISTPTVDIILGGPWLTLHSPEIRWDSCEVIRWSKFCHHHCLKDLPRPQVTCRPDRFHTDWDPEPRIIPSVTSDYVAFQDVFSKQAATQLPPHRPWDCAIGLLPGNKIPKGRVYPRSIPERKAMVEFIQEALKQGFIWPSSSPAAWSFVFVGKKDRGLRPCIDFPHTELPDSETPLSTSPGPGCHRGTPWGMHLLQAGPVEHV